MKLIMHGNSFAGKAYLVSATFLTGLFVTSVHAETNPTLGRLFSKPAERNNLNVLRQNQKLKTITAQETKVIPEMVTTIETPEPIAPITMQGYVKRSDGANTLWINKHAVQENSTANKLHIGQLNQRGFSKNGLNNEGVDIHIPTQGKHIRLKAGQMYEPETNQILEMQVVQKSKKINLEQSGVIGSANE